MGQPRRSPRELLNLDRVTAHDHNVSKSPLANNATHADNGCAELRLRTSVSKPSPSSRGAILDGTFRVNPGGCP
jgi:hypothetical protein